MATKYFLENYHEVLSYHVDLILKSRLILDEDMQLVLTFWDPTIPEIDSGWYRSKLLWTSVTCATVGLLVSTRINNIYPLATSIVPASAILLRKLNTYCYKQKYKHNFEKHLRIIYEIYELSCTILEYFHKRDMSMQNCSLPSEACAFLFKRGEEFLRHAASILIGILEKIKSVMVLISKIVPVSEGEYIHSLEWNFDCFKTVENCDLIELQHQFQKLNDIYVLLVSNYLSSIGLSFCYKLWKETPNDIRIILDNVIPELTRFLETSLKEIKSHFNLIRFTIYDEDDDAMKRRREYKSIKINLQLQRPVRDCLANLQITFETVKQLQLLIEQCDLDKEVQNLLLLVDDVSNQFELCDESLHSFLKLVCVLTNKRSLPKGDGLPSTVADNSANQISAEVRYDDASDMGKDEEYNLSIHGSEEDDDSVQPFYEYADHCSTEHLELLLGELKRKLNERKGFKNKIESQRNDENNSLLPATKSSTEQCAVAPVIVGKSPSFVPPPLPPLTIDLLPAFDNSRKSFLDSVKSVAQKLNRTEDVFGSSSDSDEI